MKPQENFLLKTIFSARKWFNPQRLHVLGAVSMGFLCVSVILIFSGYSPLEFLTTFFHGIFGRIVFPLRIVFYASILVVTALGFVLAFKAGLFNIGLEGQFMAGLLCSYAVAYGLDLPWGLHALVSLFAGFLGGFLLGLLVGVLKVFFYISEVISSIMLNWMAFYFYNYVLTWPLIRKPNSESSFSIDPSSSLLVGGEWKFRPEILEWRSQNPFWHDVLKEDIHYGLFLSIFLVVFISFFLRYSTWGYALQTIGNNKNTAAFQGIPVGRYQVWSMAFSGSLAGLSGAIFLLGKQQFLMVLMAPLGYGFDGMAVAFLALFNPSALFPAALFFAALITGGARVQSVMGIPSEIVRFMIGVIVFFMAVPYFFRSWGLGFSKIKSFFSRRRS